MQLSQAKIPAHLHDGLVEYTLPKNAMVCISAPRGSGKSVLLSNWLKMELHKRYDLVLVMSSSINLNEDYEDIRDKENVVFSDRLSEKALNGIFERQEAIMKMYRKDVRRKGVEQVDYEPQRILIVLDDVIDSGVIRFGAVIDKFAERGRHVKFTVFLTSQRLSAISRGIRTNSDLMIYFYPNLATETERVLEEQVPKQYKVTFLQKAYEIWEQIPYSFILVDNKQKGLNRFMFSTTAEFLKGRVYKMRLLD